MHIGTRLVRFCAAALSVLLLVACSPDYNWREILVDEQVGLVMFPEKPLSQARAMNFSSHEVNFNLTTAEVGKTTFAVGHAAWPAAMLADEALRQSMGQTVIASLYRNLGQEAPEQLPDFGQLFEVSGGQNGAVLLKAQVWLSDAGLVEGLVMGPADGFPHESAKQFLDSLAKGR